jgi:hypothetical protein
MGVQQVVEELHVELIVLDNQDSLGLGVHGETLRQRPEGALAVLPSIREYVLTLP